MLEQNYAGYKAFITSTKDDSGWAFTITNKPVQRTLYFTKAWDDDDNANNTRPDLVKVYLYADGAAADSAFIQIGAGNHNQVRVPTFREDGGIIQYTIQEEPVAGYVSEISGDMGDGFVITNMLKREKKVIVQSRQDKAV